MNIERVDFVNIATRDVERSRAWYRDVFGLAEDPNNPEELTAGQVTLTFWEPEKEGIEFKPNIAGFALRVDDIEAAKAEIEEKGVQIVGQGDRFGQILIEAHLPGDGPADLGNFQGMSQPRAVMIVGLRNEDLRLVH